MSVRRVDIDDELLEKAMRILGVHTIKETINIAIEKVAESEARHQRFMERYERMKAEGIYDEPSERAS